MTLFIRLSVILFRERVILTWVILVRGLLEYVGVGRKEDPGGGEGVALIIVTY